MKYEALNIEVVLLENEDVLTLSAQSEGTGESKSWNDLGWEKF